MLTIHLDALVSGRLAVSDGRLMRSARRKFHLRRNGERRGLGDNRTRTPSNADCRVARELERDGTAGARCPPLYVHLFGRLGSGDGDGGRPLPNGTQSSLPPPEPRRVARAASMPYKCACARSCYLNVVLAS